MSILNQKTINKIVLSGVGLHTGKLVSLIFTAALIQELYLKELI